MEDLTFKNACTKSSIKLQIKFNNQTFIQIEENMIQLASLANAFSFVISELEIMK